MNRIVLGGAQLGLPYGILNGGETLSREEVACILDLAAEKGIDCVDTAIAYGESESVLGELSRQRFDFITKLPPIPVDATQVTDWVRTQIEASLSRLKVNALHGLLLHNPSDLSGRHGRELYESICQLKEDRVIGKFGISIYEPDELENLINSFVIDIVQAPLNIFDRRILSVSELLKKFNIELHVRSVFLQGVLIAPPHDRPKRFNTWSNLFTKFDSWVESTGLSPISCCLGFALQQPVVKKLVIGSTSADSLRQIVTSIPNGEISFPGDLESTDPQLIDPRVWSRS